MHGKRLQTPLLLSRCQQQTRAQLSQRRRKRMAWSVVPCAQVLPSRQNRLART